ncbi:hypothetical protein BCR39DRAFT_527486 [Naematelia encephala]|uniref:Uncharacterized protein n=1 Tax=Naematelia encephala TaxID=71784 RepID=A0A1Y2B980_9TREE|nr:hypothetical protein BCR39DRAFT_527486 [Naematelia encephala]
MSWYVDQWVEQVPLIVEPDIHNRDSMVSNDTTDIYPSTRSSFTTSALGLSVSSKLAPTNNTRSLRTIESPSIVFDHGRQKHQGAPQPPLGIVAQRAAQLLEHVEQSSLSPGPTSRHHQSASSLDKTSKSAATKVAVVPTSTVIQEIRQSAAPRLSSQSIQCSPTNRPAPAAKRRASRTNSIQQPNAPQTRQAESTDTMTEDWEAELVREAEKLKLEPPNGLTPEPSTDQRPGHQEKRQENGQWEKEGMWEARREVAREAEDKTRREAGREIAYPPAAPRRPIRAAANGVTSVHVGVRPRLHPALSDASLRRNQPDEHLSTPVSPPLETSQAAILPGNVNASDNQFYVSEHAEQAKLEYEAWLRKKPEREGGIRPDDEDHGSRQWTPKSRAVARPGQIRDIAPVRVWGDEGLTPQVVPVTPRNGWEQYGYPFDYTQPNAQHGPGGYMYMDPNLYGQGYWDPRYWTVFGDHQEESQQTEFGKGRTTASWEQGQENQASDSDGNDISEQDYSDDLNHYSSTNMYNPYQQWPMMGVQGPINPYMGMFSGDGKSMTSPPQQSPMSSGQTPTDNLKAYDSTKAKQGRLGYYGFLEGRGE